MGMNPTYLRSALFLSAVMIATACSAPGEEVEQPSTDVDLTGSRQLSGAGMAANTFSLTFDDGPGPRTAELANWLGDRGIVATFFINGRNVPGNEAAIEAVRARGHILANHTQNHEQMTTQSAGDVVSAVADTDRIIAQYQPGGPWLLRPPYGAWDADAMNAVNGTAMSKYVGPIFWDVGGQLTDSHGADWACWGNGLSVETCAQRYMNEMRDRGRGVILMHDVHGKTVDMTKQIVNAMQGSASFVPLTSAPSIAAATGLIPTPPPGNPDTPPPPAGASCGAVTYQGFCTKNVITWCKDNVLTTVDCASKGEVCNYVDPNMGHDCVKKAPCGSVDYKGGCDGNVLTWCEDGALRRNNCTARSKTCTLVDAATGYDCR